MFGTSVVYFVFDVLAVLAVDQHRLSCFTILRYQVLTLCRCKIRARRYSLQAVLSTYPWDVFDVDTPVTIWCK